MFQILKDTHFDFMRGRKTWIAMTFAVIAVAALILAVNQLNLGVEFTGGTTLRLKFAETPQVGDVRNRLAAEDIRAEVTRIGDPEENEIYIRLGTVAGDLEADEEMTRRVVAALRPADTDGKVDLNVVDATSVESVLRNAPGVNAETAARLADGIVDLRRDLALIDSYDRLDDVEGMTPGIRSSLEAQTKLGPLALREQSYIGPAIGEELKRQAGIAIFGSLLGMLVYIWIRFELQWGLAAVVALFHDTAVVLALFSLFGKEMSLPVIAAFLTLVGYSVNDTVVVFDRIRENLRKKAGRPLVETINLSINQTLSRTVITGGTTFLVVAGLLVFGGAALNPFAFVLTAGIVVGTYSSIFVASPFLMLFKSWADKRKSPAARAKAAV